jgi:CheY-like chemotaxis protein
MSHDEELIRQIRDALTHLYDYAYLQRHPLADSLVPARATVTRTRAQELRRILLDAIEALNPGASVPIRAIERRGYAILFGLYVEGRDRKEMAGFLGISGRQLRRDRNTAFEALVSIVQDRYLTRPNSDRAAGGPEPFREEEEWLAEQRTPVDLHEIIAGLLPLLEPLAHQHRVELMATVEPDLPKFYTNRILMRQLLIGLANRILSNLPLRRLAFEAQLPKAQIQIGLRLAWPEDSQPGEEKGPALTPLIEPAEPLLPALKGQLHVEKIGPTEAVIWLSLPRDDEMLVLVVDDNEELFALFQRYVAYYPYRLRHAKSVAEALDLVQSIHPDLITLDLMMPERDGWELLQALKSNPATAGIPVAVCSILDDPDLAYAWGAKFYLKKPVGAVEFLQALAQIQP